MTMRRLWERLATRILLRSKNITMLAIKDRDLDRIFIAASPSDQGAWEFMQCNQGVTERELQVMDLERAFHAPDAGSDT